MRVKLEVLIFKNVLELRVTWSWPRPLHEF